VNNFSGALTAILPEMQYWQKTPDGTTFFSCCRAFTANDRALTSLHLAAT
jgi:hypothetical protein